MKKNKKQKTAALFLNFLIIFGIYFGIHPKIGNFVLPKAAHAVELNIGQAAQDELIPGTADYNPDNAEEGFGTLMSKFLNIIMIIAAFLVLMNLLWGGIQWIVSGGDKGKLESARNRITQSVIGIVVLASTITIFVMLQNFLGMEILTFSQSGGTQTENTGATGAGGATGTTGNTGATGTTGNTGIFE